MLTRLHPRQTLILSAFLFLFVGVSSIYSAPMIMTHQGRLLDNVGSPTNGQFSLTFRLFSDESSSDILWEEQHNVLTEDGLYSVLLGSNNPLDFSEFSVAPDFLFLEIQIGINPPLSPRTQLTSVPISAVAKSLKGDINIDNGSILVIDSMGDTTYQLTNEADVKVEKFQQKEDFGPVQRTSQGVNDSSGFVSMSVVENLNSSSTIISAELNRSILKQYFETGDIPTESIIKTTTDTAKITLTYDTLSEAVFEATSSGSSIRVGEEFDDGFNTYGIGVEIEPTGLSLVRGIREGGRTVGAGQVTSLSMNNFVIIDSLGDTTVSFSNSEDALRRIWNKRKFAGESSVTAEQVFESVIRYEPSDSSQLKKIDRGIDSSGAYFVMLDSLEDTTVVIEGSGGAIGGGRLVILGADANMGVAPGNVELTDLDSDGTTDIKCDGFIGIGVSLPTNILEVAQGSNTDPIADAWTTYSSRRWKENIKTLSGSLDKVLKLRGVEYDWKVDGKHDIGLIAEEVGEVIPEVVVFEENGIDAKSVDYPRLVALLIEASKEQQENILSMQKEIDELKALVTKLANQSKPTSNSSFGMK